MNYVPPNSSRDLYFVFRGEIYEPFMGLKSQVGQLGRQWGRLNQTQLLRVKKLHLCINPSSLGKSNDILVIAAAEDEFLVDVLVI